MNPPARRSRRVLLVGLDAVEWGVVRPLMAAGRLPHLERLIDRGLSGTLAVASPTHGPPLWTSVATGRRAVHHGIYAAAYPSPAHPSGVRPAAYRHRAAPAVWSVLRDQGLRSHCVAWPATYEAEPMDGVCVSDAFANDAFGAGGAAASVWPRDLHADLLALRVRPEQIGPGTLGELLDADLPTAWPDDRVLTACRAALAEAVTAHNVATELVAGDDWDFAAVFYGLVGRVSRLTMACRPPALAGVPPQAAARFGGATDGAYAFQDRLIGRLVELTGDDTDVIIVSGHGFAAGPHRPRAATEDPAEAEAAWHRGGGVCVLAGPSLAADGLIEGASIFDVAPTVLTLLGLPHAADLDGRPLLRAFKDSTEPPEVPTWPADAAAGAAGDAAEWTDAAWTAVEPLLALGYVDPSADRTPLAAEVYLTTLMSRAQSLAGAGRHAAAGVLLRRLIALRPGRRQARLELFAAAMAASDTAAARAAIEDAVLAGQGGPLTELGLAMVDLAERRPAAALEHLRRVGSGPQLAPDVLVLKGETLARLGHWQEADLAFAAATDADGSNAKAWLGRARMLRAQGRTDDAVRAVRAAIAVRPDYAAAHLESAVLSRKRHDRAAARASLLRALALDPGLTPAARLLSRWHLSA